MKPKMQKSVSKKTPKSPRSLEPGSSFKPRLPFVTGADGMLGVDLCETLRQRGIEVIGATRELMDVTDEQQVRQRLTEARPDVVIHGAAYTNVDKAEEEPDVCFAVNSEGTRHIALVCQELGARLVYISTDYVFDGRATKPYNEHAPVNPLGVYGISKARGEEHVAGLVPDHLIVRASWLQGVHCWKFRKNFIEAILAAAQKNPILKVVNDQHGSPTFTFDLSQKIIELLTTGAQGIFHICNQGQCTWFEFAHEIMIAAGVSGVQIEPITLAEYGGKAPRPIYAVLESSRLQEFGLDLLPDWKESLKEYFRRRQPL
ncbi:MAG: dTDP-4-dehydrorhamnose reductase [Candidatus Sumerlaeota bacterium]|nr:dTDP-4-dehydrorhamnose reductase [Candidatus Sumerlaeota bacterium]